MIALLLAFVMTFSMAAVDMRSVNAAEAQVVEFTDSATLAGNAMANSEQLPIQWVNDGGAAWAFDDEGHWWHSRYELWEQKGEHEVGSQKGDGKPTSENPIWIQTGFDKVWMVKELSYTSRPTGDGVAKDYTVSVAKLDDPTATPATEDFTEVKSGTLSFSTEEQKIVLDDFVEATHVRITFTDAYDAYDGGQGDGHIAAKRIRFFGKDVPGAEVTLSGISVTAPEKVNYYTGEELDLTGMVVTANYSDASSVELTAEDYTVSGFDSATAGTQTITVSYGEKTATFTVTLVEEGSAEDATKDIAVERITATAGSEEPVGQWNPNEGPVRFAFDSDEGTWWHSSFTTPFDVEDYLEEMPKYFWIQMDFEETTVVDAVRYLPRGAGNGDITGYRVDGTVDGETWTELTSGTWENNGAWQIAEFEAQELKAVRLVATATVGEAGANRFANAKEIRLRAGELAPVESVDWTALEAAIAEAEALVAEDYVDFTAVETALEAANALGEDATQDEVDAAAEALLEAVAALEVKPVDFTALEAAVADNKYIDVTEATEDSAAAYEAALAAAEAVLADEEATQEAVDAAAEALLEAVAGLKTIVTEENEIDSAVLKENARANSEQNPEAWGEGPVVFAFDDEARWWHSRYQDFDQKAEWEVGSVKADGEPSETNPIWVETGFDAVKTISAISYQGRSGEHRNIAKDYTVWVANLEDPTQTPSDEDFVKVAEGTFEDVQTEQKVELETLATATHVRLQITSVHYTAGFTNHVTAQRIRVFEAVESEEALEIKVDKSALQALVDECAALDTEAYTEETAAALAAAVEAAQAVLDNADAASADVCAAVVALEDAIAALEEKPVVEQVDKTALQDAINAANLLNPDDYVDFVPVMEALDAAWDVIDDADATQEEVDAALDALNAAVEALEEKTVEVPVDKTALEAALAEAAALVEEDYTAESWAVLAAAVEAAEALAEDADQETVNAAAAAITEAITALEKAPLAPEDESKDIPAGTYTVTAGSTQVGNSTGSATDGNASTFWEVTWDIGTTNPELLWYQIELDEAAPVEAVRYLPRWGSGAGDQNGFILSYRVEVSNDGEYWVTAAEGSWEMTQGWKVAEFEEAIVAKYIRLTGTEVYDDKGLSANMSIAEIRVREAEEGKEIETPALADKSKLESLVNGALTDLSEYTEETAKAYQDALAAAREVLAEKYATQEEVDAAKDALMAAAMGMQKKPPVDKTALQAAVDAANAADYAAYTDESVAAVEAAITAAETVLADEKATQAAVDAAKEALDKAIAALEEKPPVVEEEVVRLYGDSRYDTGYAVADALKEVLGVEKFEAVVVATGKNFADALAGSYLAVGKNAPILLTNGNDDNIAKLHAYIAANVAEGGKVYILGGEAAVPAAVEAIEGYDVVRLFGDSRYDTNLAILEEAGIAGDSIIVATGKTFADSLSASAAKLPILLVKPNAALNDAQKEILAGMKNIYIVGGEGAVSAAYAEELAAYGEVTRVFGDSRYDTSVEIAKTFCTDADKAVVASGKNFPDGLCGGPLAAALGAPLVLTKDGGTDAAAAFVAEKEIASGYVLGGTGALTDETVVSVFGLSSADEIK